MKQFRVIGMVNGKSSIPLHLHPSDFSDELYDGLSLYLGRENNLVVLFMSKNADPARWKVVDGSSVFFFRSFKNATNFCQMRRYKFVRGGASE